ncbi:hypothetical protein EDB87DRAFT_1626765 [Lactarius vividus]|nr:hypothetical protein EDB87DRAFT_1626765 [Lactarius vividus]
MDPDHHLSGLRHAIDAEINSLEESIRALKRRRNALAPISSLPTEVITTIFSFLHIPITLSAFTPLICEKPKRQERLAWLRAAHVSHQWRDIILNQPLLWSHVDFTIFSSAGVAEILSRAKKVPLHLQARIPRRHWDNARFSAFQKELQDCVPHICRLAISAEPFYLHKILKGLILPVPTLEFLSLSGEDNDSAGAVVPNTLFDGSTPRLSCLEIYHCDINWNSALLRGLGSLKHLDIRIPSERPSLSVWLDALDEMSQLKTLCLYWASPIAPLGASNLSDVERAVTLPFLTLFEMTSTARDCGLALAHLVLPALTSLCLTAESCRQDGSDVQEILPYVARHAYGPQDAQPLQSMWASKNVISVEILAWTLPDIDVEFPTQIAMLDARPSARVAFCVVGGDSSPGIDMTIFNAVMEALPLDGLVTLTVQNRSMPLNGQFWLHALKWPLLRRVRLMPPEERGFMEMLTEDDGKRESPLLPLLTTLVLVDTALLERRTLRLCDALMKRVEQGVPLETLDLRRCLATSHAIELLSEIVVNVLGPENIYETRSQMVSESAAYGVYLRDESGDNSEVEEYDEDHADTGSDDEVWGP